MARRVAMQRSVAAGEARGRVAVARGIGPAEAVAVVGVALGRVREDEVRGDDEAVSLEQHGV